MKEFFCSVHYIPYHNDYCIIKRTLLFVGGKPNGKKEWEKIKIRAPLPFTA
jgi:hypothetical protein